MTSTPEFWMYILPISMVTITFAIAICVRIMEKVYKEFHALD
jgi:hypothetical protein